MLEECFCTFVWAFAWKDFCRNNLDHIKSKCKNNILTLIYLYKRFLHKWHWWSTLVLKCFFCNLTWAFAQKYFHRNDVDDWPWCYKNLSTLWHRHLHEKNFTQIMSMIDLMFGGSFYTWTKAFAQKYLHK